MNQYEIIKCKVCGVPIHKPRTCSLKDYSARKYCSIGCRNKDADFKRVLSENGKKSASSENSGRFKKGTEPWNKGKRGYLSEEARANIGMSTANRVKSETPEQRTLRIAKAIESRKANGIWKPSMLGKKGELRVGVWKGDSASYNAKHRWIQNNWQKTGVCEDCHKKPKPFGNRKYGTEWANLDGNYDRDDHETWKELCVKCHRKLDRIKE